VCSSDLPTLPTFPSSLVSPRVRPGRIRAILAGVAGRRWRGEGAGSRLRFIISLVFVICVLYGVWGRSPAFSGQVRRAWCGLSPSAQLSWQELALGGEESSSIPNKAVTCSYPGGASGTPLEWTDLVVLWAPWRRPLSPESGRCWNKSGLSARHCCLPSSQDSSPPARGRTLESDGESGTTVRRRRTGCCIAFSCWIATPSSSRRNGVEQKEFGGGVPCFEAMQLWGRCNFMARASSSATKIRSPISFVWFLWMHLWHPTFNLQCRRPSCGAAAALRDLERPSGFVPGAVEDGRRGLHPINGGSGPDCFFNLLSRVLGVKLKGYVVIFVLSLSPSVICNRPCN